MPGNGHVRFGRRPPGKGPAKLAPRPAAHLATLRPESPRTDATPARAPQPARRDSTSWAHPALTGMPAAEWARLTAALVIPYQAHREARRHILRGGPARRKPAGGYPPALTLDEMILATVLRARFRLPRRVLAELFGVVTGTIANAEGQARPLLSQARHVIEPAETTFKTLDELTAFAAAHGVTLIPGTKAAC
jgi:hypothetical protein